MWSGLRFVDFVILVTAEEAFDAAGRVHELVFARVERVTRSADVQPQAGLGRMRHKLVPARARHLALHVLRVNIGSHRSETIRCPHKECKHPAGFLLDFTPTIRT